MLTRSLASTLRQTILLLAMAVRGFEPLYLSWPNSVLPNITLAECVSLNYTSMERKFQSFHQLPFGYSLSRSTYQTTIGYPLCYVLESDVLALEPVDGLEPPTLRLQIACTTNCAILAYGCSMKRSYAQPPMNHTSSVFYTSKPSIKPLHKAQSYASGPRSLYYWICMIKVAYSIEHGASDGSRTRNPLLGRQILWPIELHSHIKWLVVYYACMPLA